MLGNYKKIAIIDTNINIPAAQVTRIPLSLEFDPSRIIICFKDPLYGLSVDSSQQVRLGYNCLTYYTKVKITNISRNGFDVEKTGINYEGVSNTITNIIAIE